MISFGAVLGKVSSTQLLVMVFFEMVSCCPHRSEPSRRRTNRFTADILRYQPHGRLRPTSRHRHGRLHGDSRIWCVFWACRVVDDWQPRCWQGVSRVHKVELYSGHGRHRVSVVRGEGVLAALLTLSPAASCSCLGATGHPSMEPSPVEARSTASFSTQYFPVRASGVSAGTRLIERNARSTYPFSLVLLSVAGSCIAAFYASRILRPGKKFDFGELAAAFQSD